MCVLKKKSSTEDKTWKLKQEQMKTLLRNRQKNVFMDRIRFSRIAVIFAFLK